MREYREARLRHGDDPDAAAPYIGFARTLLGQLKNEMGFSGLKQGVRRKFFQHPCGLVEIIVQSIFGMDQVSIRVPKCPQPEERDEQELQQFVKAKIVWVADYFLHGPPFDTFDVNNTLSTAMALDGAQEIQIEGVVCLYSGDAETIYDNYNNDGAGTSNSDYEIVHGIYAAKLPIDPGTFQEVFVALDGLDPEGNGGSAWEALIRSVGHRTGETRVEGHEQYTNYGTSYNRTYYYRASDPFEFINYIAEQFPVDDYEVLYVVFDTLTYTNSVLDRLADAARPYFSSTTENYLYGAHIGTKFDSYEGMSDDEVIRSIAAINTNVRVVVLHSDYVPFQCSATTFSVLERIANKAILSSLLNTYVGNYAVLESGDPSDDQYSTTTYYPAGPHLFNDGCGVVDDEHSLVPDASEYETSGLTSAQKKTWVAQRIIDYLQQIPKTLVPEEIERTVANGLPKEEHPPYVTLGGELY